tara:strand:+ start:623 stop:970 length:348 start_codon:yes stop_codon:yes gene_type:complete
VVTRPGEKPSAILLRAAEPLEGLELMAQRRGVKLNSDTASRKLLSGPGKICQALDINKIVDGSSYNTDSLFFNIGCLPQAGDIFRTPRIGLNPRTCGDSTQWQWRYTLNSIHLSQ